MRMFITSKNKYLWNNIKNIWNLFLAFHIRIVCAIFALHSIIAFIMFMHLRSFYYTLDLRGGGGGGKKEKEFFRQRNSEDPHLSTDKNISYQRSQFS